LRGVKLYSSGIGVDRLAAQNIGLPTT